MKKTNTKTKSNKVLFFVWMVITEKKLSNSHQIFDYANCYHSVSFTTFKQIIRLLKEYGFITVRKRLEDTRTKVIFSNQNITLN